MRRKLTQAVDPEQGKHCAKKRGLQGPPILSSNLPNSQVGLAREWYDVAAWPKDATQALVLQPAEYATLRGRGRLVAGAQQQQQQQQRPAVAVCGQGEESLLTLGARLRVLLELDGALGLHGMA